MLACVAYIAIFCHNMGSLSILTIRLHFIIKRFKAALGCMTIRTQSELNTSGTMIRSTQAAYAGNAGEITQNMGTLASERTTGSR